MKSFSSCRTGTDTDVTAASSLDSFDASRDDPGEGLSSLEQGMSNIDSIENDNFGFCLAIGVLSASGKPKELGSKSELLEQVGNFSDLLELSSDFSDLFEEKSDCVSC